MMFQEGANTAQTVTVSRGCQGLRVCQSLGFLSRVSTWMCAERMSKICQELTYLCQELWRGCQELSRGCQELWRGCQEMSGGSLCHGQELSRGWHEGHCSRQRLIWLGLMMISAYCAIFLPGIQVSCDRHRLRLPSSWIATAAQLKLRKFAIFLALLEPAGFVIAFVFGCHSLISPKTHMTRMISAIFDPWPGIVVTDIE